MRFLVSIIIPTFNRAHLIGETLDSVLAQTYENWECIVVDDGSSDATDFILKGYLDRDSRFIYKHRPAIKPKGANACRNIGLDSANGDYIVFFDSDDLMTPDHLQVKISALQNSTYDFVITRTEFFNAPNNNLDRYYTFGMVELTSHNYILQHINWLTLDICVRRSVVGSIRFNESLQSGQEYNFYSKLVIKTERGKFVDKVVSLRRYHDDSTQGQIKTTYQTLKSSFLTRWITFNDLYYQMNINTRKALLYQCIVYVYRLKEVPENKFWSMAINIFRVYGISGYNFVIMCFLRKHFNKGYGFRSRLNPRT